MAAARGSRLWCLAIDCSRPAPLPEGFSRLSDVIEVSEKIPSRKAALERARQRLAAKLYPEGQPGIAWLRMRKGWSQKQLAEAIGTKQPHIARIESGTEDVMLSTLRKLALALDVSIEQIDQALRISDE